MHFMKQHILAVGLITLSASVSASTITWTTQAFTDTTQISPLSNVLSAYNYGNSATVAVNGVDFVGHDALTQDDAVFRFGQSGAKMNHNSGDSYDAANTVTGLSVADANALMDFFSYNDQTNMNWLMTLKNLQIGETYQIQAIVVDDRAAQSGRNMHFGPDGNSWGAAYDYTSAGAPLLATGTFVADATTQDFRQGYQGTGAPQFNAMIISTTAVPEPSSLVLLAAGTVALMSVRRRLR